MDDTVDNLCCVFCLNPVFERRKGENVRLIFECSKEHLQSVVQLQTDCFNWVYSEEIPLPFCTNCFNTSRKIYQATTQLTTIRAVIQDLILEIKLRISKAVNNTQPSERENAESVDYKDEMEEYVSHELDVKPDLANEEIEEITGTVFDVAEVESLINQLECPKMNYDRSKDLYTDESGRWPRLVLERITAEDSKIRKRSKTTRKSGQKKNCCSRTKQARKKQSHTSSYIQLDGGLFECEICRGHFESEQRVKWHMAQVHPLEKRHTCETCGLKFKRKTALEQHTEVVHNKILKFKCSKCEKSFGIGCNLRRHEETHKKDCERKKYKCNICGDKYFTQSSVLLNHQAQFHTVFTDNVITCRKCDHKFLNGSELFKHNQRKTQVPAKCFVCEEGFLNHCDLVVHFGQVHPTEDLPYQCQECHIVFSAVKNLELHGINDACGTNISNFIEELEIENKESFKCKICEKTFAQPRLVKCHVKTHSGVMPFSCSFCGRGFSSKISLNRHEKTHSSAEVEEKTAYSCQVCHKNFSSTIGLRQHEIVHGETPFSCGTCGKRFSSSLHLANHAKKHIEKEPFTCKTCGKSFSTNAVLKQHQFVHTGEKKHVCSICQKRYSNSHALKIHVMTHTGEKPFVCECCGKGFTSTRVLKIHVLTHTGEKPFSCSYCAAAFSSLANFKRHEKSHTGEKRFQCTLCKKAFIQSVHLQTHLRIHTGERPFLCTSCGKSFGDRSTWYKHEKTHVQQT